MTKKLTVRGILNNFYCNKEDKQIDHALTQLKWLELGESELTVIVLKAWRDFEAAINPPSLQRYVAKAIIKAQQAKWEGK